MNHKILFVDLDATLLSDDKTVSEENRAAIQKMLLAGHDIVLSTGRPVESGRAGSLKEFLRYLNRERAF